MFFYSCSGLASLTRGVTSFSPPKGIHCFSTREGFGPPFRQLNKFQSPEGDSLLFYRGSAGESSVNRCRASFSPPKGIRELVKWSLVWWSGRPKTEGAFDQGQSDDPTIRPIPFQSPEGDSLSFYLFRDWKVYCFYFARFSPPKGIHCFSTERIIRCPCGRFSTSFSPPKGIHCFSTPLV